MANVLQVPVPNGQATPVWSSRQAGVNSLLFINQDLNNTVWLGSESNVTPGGPNSIPLAPNGTFSGDAQSQWYVVGSNAGVKPLVVVPNGQAYFLGITQGLGNLVIPSVQSPNFVTGVSGWIIRKDGSAEFNNLVVRGSTVIGSTLLAYTSPAGGLNQLVYSNTVNAFTDQYGNSVLAGSTQYGLSGLTYYAINISVGTGNGDLFGGTYEVFTGTDMTAWSPSGTFTIGANGVAELTVSTLKVRPVNGALANAPVVASHPGTPGINESWQNMTLINGWSLGGGGYAQYKMGIENLVFVRGANVIPGTITGGTSIWAIPPFYQPATVVQVPMFIGNSTGAAGVLTARFDTVASAFECFNIPTGTTRVGWNGSYALD